MTGQLMSSLRSPLGARVGQVSVEEKIVFFTSFTCVMSLACGRCTKRLAVLHNRHYATDTRPYVPLLTARMSGNGHIFCRIRAWGRGAGVLGDLRDVSRQYWRRIGFYS